jgi:hypothetical protein
MPGCGYGGLPEGSEKPVRTLDILRPGRIRGDNKSGEHAGYRSV